MKKHVALIYIAIMLASLLAAGCGNKVQPGSSDVKRPIISGVAMMDVKRTMVDEYNETSGTIKAKTTSVVASQVMGMITDVLVKEGDRVSPGQVLMTIDDRDIAPRVAAAEAGYRESLKALEMAGQSQSLASITYERYQQLFNENAISRQQRDQVESQRKVADLDFQRVQESVNRAQAGLAEAQAYHGFTRITAPTEGVITAKKADIGSMAVPGVPLLVVEDDSSYLLEADVDESLAGKLVTGMPVTVTVDSMGKSIKGTIVEIAPAIDPATRKFHIKIAVLGDGLRSGLYASIKIPTAKKEALLLPKTAIVEKGQLTGVYVVGNGGVTVYRIVRIGKQYDSNVEILSGLNDGEKVIIGGIDKVSDGGVVKEVTGQ